MIHKRVLITGISGGLAQLVSRQLAQQGHEVIGVDYRGTQTDGGASNCLFYRANYNKTRIEDIFRRHRPEWVLHLGRVGNLKEQIGKRFDLNVIGSKKIMRLSRKYGASRLLVLSTFHIYGAHPLNHTPIYEDEPLRAGADFPQIADAIQLDHQALQFAYQHPDLPTILLRPCHVIGPNIKNAISNTFRRPTVVYPLGFNPMVQFIHESDLVSAILVAADGDAVGVFNVAGRSPIPYKLALQLTGAHIVPIPHSLGYLYLKTAGLFKRKLPTYLINFLKYPCVISDKAFRETFHWKPQIGETEAILSTVGEL